MVCYLANVTGKVQGVYFRVSCQQIAIDLSISGYARNLKNGDVEVLMCGDQSAINRMLLWLEEGPKEANVTGVTYKEIPWQQYNFFSVE